MESTYNVNGLIFWNEHEMRLREFFREQIVWDVTQALKYTNPRWQVIGVEAPVLMPRELVNKNYTDEDIYSLGELALRPETTPGSYVYLRSLLDDKNSGVLPPVCVWQSGKSFRREQDQVTKNMRLKEFYQLEFQCVFTDDTKNDYQAALAEPVAKILKDLIGLPTRVVDSDRLPSYSKKTLDVEMDNGDKWMEVCSMSLRTDFPGTVKFQNKGGVTERGLLVFEIAVGLCRLIFNYMQRTKKAE